MNQTMIERIRKEITKKGKIKSRSPQINKITNLKLKKRKQIKVKKGLKVMSK